MKKFTRLLVIALLAAGVALPAFAAQSAAPKAKKKAKGPNPVFAPITADPKLPNVLLIGDSISIGYTPVVREALKGKANVYRVPENAGDTGKGVEKLDAWLGDTKWSVIHFNWGLHDLKHWKDNKLDMSAPVVNTPEKYGENLEGLVKRMKATGAKLIFATTTPAPEGSQGRVAGSEATYNDVALKIMKAEGVAVNDLCGFIKPNLAKYQLPQNVHFTPEGYQALGKKVAGEIEKQLGGAKDAKGAKKGKSRKTGEK